MSTAPAPVHAAPPAPPEPDAPAPPPPRRRRPVLLILGLLVAVGAAATAVAWWRGRGVESTDDAFVDADVVAVAPRLAGLVARVAVKEDDHVKAGDLLLELDDADLAARQRQAAAEVEVARAQALAAGAQIGAASAAAVRAGAEYEKATLDLKRTEALSAGQAVAAERLDAARTAGSTMQAGVSAARAQVEAAGAQRRLALARVEAAEAALALVTLQRTWTRVTAPRDGVISALSARAGQLVAAGQPLAQLVPTDFRVVANFKETQLARLRPGQPAEVVLDADPGHPLLGEVESLSAGTGARFALIPPDNASGNFVKVVERVPVRIRLGGPPPAVPLRAGLSAEVSVRVR